MQLSNHCQQEVLTNVMCHPVFLSVISTYGTYGVPATSRTPKGPLAILLVRLAPLSENHTA